ncbi:hypothetical protein [Streptomyces sp. NPDC054765]
MRPVTDEAATPGEAVVEVRAATRAALTAIAALPRTPPTSP